MTQKLWGLLKKFELIITFVVLATLTVIVLDYFYWNLLFPNHAALFFFILFLYVVFFPLEFVITRIMDKAKEDFSTKQPIKELPKTWNLIITPDKSPGRWIGRLERILFFIAFWQGWYEKEALIIIGAWLTFKVASKWQVWSNVINIPKSLPEEREINKLIVYLEARKRWGNALYTSFVIGTLANILSALFGAVASRYLTSVLSCTI